jgi:hypothetical protein
MKTRIFYLLITIFPGILFSQTTVTTDGRNIKVNEQVYQIHGVCYYPVAIGDDRFDTMDFSQIDQDIQLMQQAKINTIRTYMPIIKPGILDKFAAAGIKVIIGFPNYDDTFRYPDISNGTYLNYINANKGHDAILMWELGNEYNYHSDWFDNNINNWYTILNNAVAAIHEADSNHPVSTAHGEVPTSTVLGLCPNVDVWGMNVYRYVSPLGAITEFNALSSKPCYLSESGTDRYNNTEGSENQQNQADAVLAIWNNIKGNFDKFSGITYFSFVDEWWKSGNPGTQDASGFAIDLPYDNYANEEWWGIVDIERNTTLAYSAIKTSFSGPTDIDNASTMQGYVLFPNPAVDKTTLKLEVPISEKVYLSISSITGSVLVSETLMVDGSEIIFSFDGYQLAKGVYNLSVRGKSVNITNLLVVR